MQHLAILPILIPLLAGVLLLLPPLHGSLIRQRLGSLAALLVLLGVSIIQLLEAASGTISVYSLGDWPAPFGIILVLDRLSALMVLLTGILGLAAAVYACVDDDKQGEFFHPLLQFQLMGINGAFLTGDLFNLFVFFEVLLIASYALVIHGGGKLKTRASLHYVTLNLVGSSLFLFALGTLYGTLGTLNMADMARQVAQLSADERPLVEAGALLLLVVFSLKAAAFPLYFWLPSTYSSVAAPVAALFAIMTKVGIYSILRVYSLIFGSTAGALADLASPWLWPMAILTMLAATAGILASPSLRQQIAYLVILSVGVLLGGLALNTEQGTTALLYYLLHTTLVSAGLFLLADLIAHQRGQAGDRIVGHPLPRPALFGTLFCIAAIAMIGMPPLSGFIGKALLLQAADTETSKLWLWPPLLLSSLLVLIALSRTGSTLFWRGGDLSEKPARIAPVKLAATISLLLAAPTLSLLAGPVTAYAQATAAQWHKPTQLINRVLAPDQKPQETSPDATGDHP